MVCIGWYLLDTLANRRDVKELGLESSSQVPQYSKSKAWRRVTISPVCLNPLSMYLYDPLDRFKVRDYWSNVVMYAR